MGTFGSQCLEAMSAASAWAGMKLWAAVCAVGRFVRWLLVPQGGAPLDYVKHYVSLVIAVIGVGALAWSAKQILYPPLVITVANLPDPIAKEYWLNPELSRTLIGEIERLRAVVKGERDPAFEAVLNPPNITVKTGDWSLNVQEQILTPLGSLLGRGQGEVHLALNCYHVACARTTDKECRDVISPKALDGKSPESTVVDGKAASRQYLCLRLTADIQRGLSHSRLTSRLVVSPDDAEMTDAMARVAEAVTNVADPATATLYFYRRIREKKREPRDPSVTADVIADLFSEAAKAAEHAEQSDTVSACWAHTIRAHLAVDQREFNLAQTYLARARRIVPSSNSSRLDCQHLIRIAEMEFARQLAQPPESETYPPFSDDDDEKRVQAALDRVNSLLEQQQQQSSGWAGIFGNSAGNDDLTDALKLVKAEIGLSQIDGDGRCDLLKAVRHPELAAGKNASAAESTPEPAATRLAIRDAVKKLNSLEPGVQLPTLTRQSALDLMSRFAHDSNCAEEVVGILQKIDLNHPGDERVWRLLLAIAEDAALKKTPSLEGRPADVRDRGNPMIKVAQKIYQRTAATGTGTDRTIALTRLAIIAEANRAEDDEENSLTSDEALQNLDRVWQRHVHDINSTRERGELIVSFWGMVLMRSYPDDILTADLSTIQGAVTGNKEHRDAIAKKAKFELALRTLYPDAPRERLADLPYLDDIGPRIGCLCMLSYVTSKSELADFFIARLDKWQGQRIDPAACRRELIPPTQTRAPVHIVRQAASTADRLTYAEKKLSEVEKRLQDADPKPPRLQAELQARKEAREKAQAARDSAQAALDQAQEDAKKASQRYEEKVDVVKEAAKVCYVDARAPPAPITP